MHEIKIKRPLAMHLLSLAQLSPEKEICGLVGCVDGQLTTCYPITNISDSPETAFLMHPEEQAAAIGKMKEKGEDVFAVYHSHPTAPAVPSEKDVKELGYPNALYLIISLNTKGVLEMAAYNLNNNSVEAVDLTI